MRYGNGDPFCRPSLQDFTKSMEILKKQETNLNGEQDDGIIDALKRIGETIEFRHSSGCVIS